MLIKFDNLSDKYYKNYANLFVYKYKNFKYVNKYLLYNYILQSFNNILCGDQIESSYKDSPINHKVSIKNKLNLQNKYI
jgi:hypothetical protein